MTSLSGSRIMVIGGAGFIGSHVVDILRAEDVAEIRIYDNFCRGSYDNLEEALADPRVSVCRNGGDILHEEVLGDAMRGCDYVIHLAALWLLHCHEFPRAAFEVNVRGTFNVLEACRAHGVKRLVYSSSASVYGDAVAVPMTEEHPQNNRTFYGATKVAGEQFCRAYFHRYGLPYVGLRYMNVYGSRQDYEGAYVAVIMKILDRLDRGLPPVVYGDGSQSYDFVYVTDAARANVCALRSDAVDRCYNVGSGTRTTVKELCELLQEITGSSASVEYEAAGPTFVTHRVGSTEAAERELGFRAGIMLREGLERLVRWRAAHRELVAKQGIRAP